MKARIAKAVTVLVGITLLVLSVPGKTQPVVAQSRSTVFASAPGPGLHSHGRCDPKLPTAMFVDDAGQFNDCVSFHMRNSEATLHLANNEFGMQAHSPAVSRDLLTRTLMLPASFIVDPSGDASPPHLDVLSAEVIQVDDGLQFNMTLAGNVPQIVEPDHQLTYIWLVDTDQNTATGQAHRYVGSEYNVRLANYDGLWQGWVDVVNGDDPGGGAGVVFVHENTVSMRISRGQINSTMAFNWEIDSFSDASWGDAADGYATTTLAETPPAVNGISNVRIYPPYMTLRDGQTNGAVGALALDSVDAALSLIGRQVQFFSTRPSAATVDDVGTVTGIGYGNAQITAQVDGVVSSNATQVTAGRFNLLPPILLLSVNDKHTGQLTVRLEDADGTPVLLADKTVEFASSNSTVASVSNDGTVTAHQPPQTFSETPYVSVQVDNVYAENAAVIRVTSETLGLSMISLSGSNIAFQIAQEIGDYNYEQIFSDYEVVRVTDIAYQLKREATGTTPSNGGIQYLVNDPGHGGDGTVPCGLSGNPVRLGTDVDKNIHNSCLIVAIPDAFPQWSVFFHEIGHNFTLDSYRFSDFTGSHSDADYVEGLATLADLYAIDKMVAYSSTYGLSDQIVATMIETALETVYLDDLDAYVAAGADYSALTPNIIDGILLRLREEYGLSFFYRLFSVFLPANEALEENLGTDSEVATYFAAACSAAARTDLRSQFRDEWGFPIDESFFEQIYSNVQAAVAQRDPHARVRVEELVQVGSSVAVDGSGSYDPQGLPLIYTWSLTGKPTGSMATLSDTSSVSPTLTVDLVGYYTVTLEVDNGLVTSPSATQTISASLTLHDIYLPLVVK